jgi:transposase-like protein
MQNLSTETTTEAPEKRVTRTYSDAERFKAVALYVNLGTLSAVASELQMSRETLKDWKEKDWWKQYERQIKNEENALLSAKYRKIVQKTQDQILERLEGGDTIVLKDGSQHKIPVKARELALIAAISTDKILGIDRIQETREESVSIEQRLTMLADEFKKFQHSKSKPVNIIDVTPSEEPINA